MTFSHGISTNNYGPAKFIVDASAANGTHTTIATALTSSASGDTIFVRPGTYTENLTLKAGVSITAFRGDSDEPNVTIVGKATFSAAGTATISNIRLQTNSDFILVVSGSSASVVKLNACFFNCTNNTGLSFTSSSASAAIVSSNCQGDLGTTGISFLSSSSAGVAKFNNCFLTNSGASSTVTTASAGTLVLNYSMINSPVSSTSTAALTFYQCIVDSSAQNATAVTFNGSGQSGAQYTYFSGGTASAVSIGGASVQLNGCTVASSNTNAVTGAGTLLYTPVDFVGSSTVINTTTRTPLNYGTWTPTVTGAAVAGTTTYTTQAGFYTVVGNAVLVEGTIVITAATGTGNATIGGLPFTVKNLTSYNPRGVMALASAAWAWGGGTQLLLAPTINTTNALVSSLASTAAANLQMTNGAGTFAFSCWYQI